jgi:hypothetical protein
MFEDEAKRVNVSKGIPGLMLRFYFRFFSYLAYLYRVFILTFFGRKLI